MNAVNPVNTVDPFRELSEKELRQGEQLPEVSTGSPLASSIINPSNSVLYVGTENKFIDELRLTDVLPLTSEQRARETVQSAGPEQDPFRELPPSDFERTPTVDDRGLTRPMRELLDKYENKKVKHGDREITLGEMRQGHYFYSELKKLYTKRGEDPLNKDVDKYLRNASLFLAEKFPDDPMLERTAMTVASIPKIPIQVGNAALAIGDAVAETSGRVFRNILNQADLYSDQEMKNRYGDQSKNPFMYMVQKFMELDEKTWEDGAMASHNLRPFVIDLFQRENIEIPGDISAILLSTKNPDADFISYLTHYLATGFTPATAVTLIRKGLRNATRQQLSQFAGQRGIKDISKMQGTEFGKLVDNFLESKTNNKFPIPIVRNAVDNIGSTFRRGRISQSEYMVARKAETIALEEEANLLGKQLGRRVSVREAMNRRLEKPVADYNKVWSNPNSTQAERVAAKTAMEDIALKNYMGRRFGVYDPITREEMMAELLFAMGAATYDYATKNNNYKGTDNAMSVVAGMASIFAGQRAVPRGALKIEGYARERFLDTMLWLKNGSFLSPSAVRANTPEAAKLRGERAIKSTLTAFPPERRIVLDQTGALQAGRTSANRTRYIAGVGNQGNLKRLSPEKRKRLEPIISAIKLGGVSDDILDQLDRIDKYRTAYGKVTGSTDDFDTGFSAIIALQPLMALQDTTSTSLTGMLGGVKIEKLQQHITLARQTLDILNQAKKGFDNFTPQRLKRLEGNEELLDFVNGLLEMKKQAESSLGGTINRLEIELSRLDESFNQNQQSFKDRNGDISNAGTLLRGIDEAIQKLKEDAGITAERAGEDARISVAEGQVGAARQSVDDLQRVVGDQDRDLSTATTTASTIREGLTAPQVREDNTNSVVRSYIEEGKPEKALFELALNVRNARDSYFNREFADLYKGIEVNIDDSGFIGGILAKFTEISYGDDLSTAMAKLARQEVIPSDLRPIVGAIEGASARKLHEYYASLGPLDGRVQRVADIEAYREAFPEGPVYSWLILTTLKNAGEIGQGLKWNLNDLDLLRRSLNNRASNLEGVRRDELISLSEDVNETITSELRKSGGEAKVAEREALRVRYRDEVRGGMYESEIGRMVHEARSRAGGMLNEGELIRRFDLNTTLYGDRNQYDTFIERLERFFGQPGEKVGEQAPKYTLTPETVVEAGNRKDNIMVGANLKAIFTAMNHSAMLQSTTLKNTNLKLNTVAGYTDMGDTRENLFKNVTPLNADAVRRLALLENRAADLGGMFQDVGSKEFALSLQRLIESSATVQKQFENTRNEINRLATNTRNIQRGIEELADDSFKVTATSIFMDRKITNIDDFIDTYGMDNSLATTLPKFFENLTASLKTQDKYKNIKDADLVDQLKEAFYEQVIKRVRNKTFGPSDDTAQIVQVDDFNPDAFVEFVRDNGRLIEALLPDKKITVYAPVRGENLELPKKDFVETLSEFAESIRFLSVSSKQKAPGGIMAYATKGLSPSSWISRIYAVDRNVVSPRYVVTEALLVRLRMKKGADLQALLSDPELLYYMDSIIRTGNVLPKGDNDKFNLALKRAIAQNVNEGKDPQKTGLDTQQQLDQFEQNFMAQSAGIGGDLVPQTRMP